jgi:GNAT superfamily N-acetyltransferase
VAEEEPFLTRWSRRKAQARRGPPPEGGQAVEKEQKSDGEREAARAGDEVAEGRARASPAAPSAATEFADVDFEALDFDADYTRFLAPDMPEAIRNRALRRLWQSHPVFTAADPYQDYQGDYTDAAVAVPAGMLKTAYRIGRGYLEQAPAGDASSIAAVAIGVATPEDSAALQALIAASAGEASAIPPRAAEAGLAAAWRLLVARSGAAVVGGGALLSPAAGGVEIGVLFVTPEARGAGIGTALLAGLEAQARRHDALPLRVRLMPGARAVALFLRQGFRERTQEDGLAVLEKALA